MSSDELHQPDYQYELFENLARVGWAAAFPEWANPTEDTTPEEFRKAFDAWMAFMDNATMEMARQGWKISIPVTKAA